MNIIFMGTPDFAAASLKALLSEPRHHVLATYCQPDRPAGRGHGLKACAVKQLAVEHDIPVLQPVNFKNPESLRELAAFKADIFVVAAYGIILPQALLDIPQRGVINVHASLLPEYRGAAPIQRAVMDGQFRSGITIMKVQLKLDSGPIILQRALGIGPDQTAGELHDELAAMGGRLLLEALQRIEEGRALHLEQDDALATYAAKLVKADGILDFRQKARDVHHQARGVTPWPGAQVTINVALPKGKEETIQAIVEAGTVLDDGKPGDTINLQDIGLCLPVRDGVIPVQCSQGVYGIKQLRPAGRKSMTAEAFANGYLKGCAARALLLKPE